MFFLPYSVFFAPSSYCINGSFHCEGEKCNVTDMCPENQLYDTQAPGCPVTCESVAHGFSCGVEAGPGCMCPEGYLLDVSI